MSSSQQIYFASTTPRLLATGSQQDSAFQRSMASLLLNCVDLRCPLWIFGPNVSETIGIVSLSVSPGFEGSVA
eukprot:1972257-Amphidinium_carterae.1